MTERRFVQIEPGAARVLTGPPHELQAGWGRVRVTACGICGSDLHLLHGMEMPRGASYPVRPGHEVAGVLIEGTADGLAEGDQVVLHPLLPCGDCESCLRGLENLCRNGTVLGIHHAGGLADEVVWPLRRMVAVPGLPAEQAAILPDAVASAYHALMLAALPPSGASLTVLGAGGVGSHILQLARVLDPEAKLTAVVRSEATARRLESLDLDVTLVEGLEGSGPRVAKTAGPQHAVIEFGAGADACREALPMLGRGGTLVIGSIDDRQLELATTLTAMATRELHVVGSYSSTLADLHAVAQLAVTGSLDLSASVSHRLPLDEAPQALELLEQRPPGLSRVVVIP